MAGRIGRRIYDDPRWRGLREWFRANEPLCRSCRRRGEDEIAHELDHIVPLDRGGAPFDRSNLQPLCRTCHQDKTATENRSRGGGFRPLVDVDGRPLGKKRP